MELENIFKLLDAGFTHDEIVKLNNTATPTPTEPTNNPNNEETKPNIEEKTKPNNEENETLIKLTSQVESLAGIVKDLQNQNVKNASTPAPEKETVNDAIKSFFGKQS